ncbi:hypothetical protein [Actinoplanes solisilvae]|uniref:hypothetical protein n=1 Tax=Actinoplanes solisilvae TaxID=2486853 RepID=UPI000FD6CBFC|nr:hypothetical protein [Actinoplanes solisilvae]
MSDFDRAIRDADPYRPQVVRDLDGAQQSLLEEILSAPTPVRHAFPRRLAIAAAAAVVTAAAVAVPLIVRGSGTPALPVAAPPSSSGAPVPVGDSPAKPRQFPRLLVDDPGWKAIAANGFTDENGTMTFRKGQLHLEVNFYPAWEHEPYLDRFRDDPATPVKVDGRPATQFRLRADRYVVMMRPRDGVAAEFSTVSDGWTRAEFDRVRDRIRLVDAATWLAALPPEIVTPARAAKAAATDLDDVPLPPGFAFEVPGVNDRVSFGVALFSRVNCGWVAEWIRADQAGDRAARSRATDALRGSHDWKAVRRMSVTSDWPAFYWDVADKTVAGHPPAGYRNILGCE